VKAEQRTPYSALAEIYDRVMSHVDHAEWAAYLAYLIGAHAPDKPSVLELGCGTGSLTLNLVPRLEGTYRASDSSPEMLSVARDKLSGLPDVGLELLDFRALDHANRYDVVLLAYDGINYARNTEELRQILAGVVEVVRPGGLFMFDQSTPPNSINNLSYFDDEFVGDGISYSRTSSYDEQTRIHVTRFSIEKGESVMIERHEQRAFTRMELLESAHSAHFEVVKMLTAFESEPANDETERIQWILRSPSSTDNRTEA